VRQVTASGRSIYLKWDGHRTPIPRRLLLHKLQAARMDFGWADCRPRAARPLAASSAIGIQAEMERSDVSACILRLFSSLCLCVSALSLYRLPTKNPATSNAKYTFQSTLTAAAV